MNKRFISLNEASQRTGLSRSYLYKLTSSKLITFFKPTGKLIFFDVDDLDAWLSRNRIAPSDEIKQKADEYLLNQKMRRAAK